MTDSGAAERPRSGGSIPSVARFGRAFRPSLGGYAAHNAPRTFASVLGPPSFVRSNKQRADRLTAVNSFDRFGEEIGDG